MRPHTPIMVEEPPEFFPRSDCYRPRKPLERPGIVILSVTPTADWLAWAQRLRRKAEGTHVVLDRDGCPHLFLDPLEWAAYRLDEADEVACYVDLAGPRYREWERAQLDGLRVLGRFLCRYLGVPPRVASAPKVLPVERWMTLGRGFIRRSNLRGGRDELLAIEDATKYFCDPVRAPARF